MIETVVSGAANAAGIAVARMRPQAYARRVTGCAVTCTSAVQTVATVHAIHEATPYLDASSAGNGDAANWSPPLDLPRGADFVVRWSGCTPGAVGTAQVSWVPA